jgi:pentatricopeptide repeat protein
VHEQVGPSTDRQHPLAGSCIFCGRTHSTFTFDESPGRPVFSDGRLYPTSKPMKQTSAVCLACRFKLLVRQQASLRPAWQPAGRTFGTAAAATSSEPVELPARTSPRPPASKPKQKRPSKPDQRLEKQRGRKAAAALAVFKNVVEGKDSKKDGPTPADNLATIELYKCVATLEEMLSKPEISTATCFEYFNSDIYARISRQHARIPRILRDRVGKVLISRVAREKAADFDAKGLPSVTLISQIFLELGLFEPDAWAKLTTALLEHICGVSASPQDYTSIESYETAMARRDTLLHDLVGSWKMFNVPPFVAARTGDGARAASTARLPSLEQRHIAFNSRRGKAPLSVASLFPHYAFRSLRLTIPAAIATYVLLADPINRATRIFRHEVGPFVDAMAAVLHKNRPKREDLGALYGQYPELLGYITERWPAVETQLEEQSKFEDTAGGAEDDQGSQVTKRVHRQLGQAWNTWNPKVLNRAWEEFWGTYATPSDAKLKQCRENPELFNYFIMAYMAMRQPTRAIEVWNSMSSIGIEPTVKTWNAMIDGCRRANNLLGLKNVWTKLIASNMKLDPAIWTARVSGLIELGSPDEGLAALDEMARIWKANQKLPLDKRSPAAVKPTIEPVNAALAGLLRLQKLSSNAAASLLGWAAKQGLEPDIYTFNTLLRPLLKQGLDSEVQKLLKTMQKQNLEADVATFTILLEGALEDIGEQTPNQQVQTVNTFLRNMRNAGVTANMQLYAKMIHLLLQQGDRAEEPVKALLAHIWGQGLELTSHIYTMLADHYFTRSPPDTDAVTALIENRRLHDNRDIDRVFWERVIFGYCQVGDVAVALHIFDKMEKSGSKISLSTLYELLLVLGRSGQTSSVAKVIEFAKKAKDQPEELIPGRSPRFWHHRFWHLAQDYGFSREDLQGKEAVHM